MLPHYCGPALHEHRAALRWHIGGHTAGEGIAPLRADASAVDEAVASPARAPKRQHRCRSATRTHPWKAHECFDCGWSLHVVSGLRKHRHCAHCEGRAVQYGHGSKAQRMNAGRRAVPPTHSALRVQGTPAGAGGAQTRMKQMPVAQSESWSLRQAVTSSGVGIDGRLMAMAAPDGSSQPEEQGQKQQ